MRRLRVAAEVPAECPRARGLDGDGPRCCAYTGCRYHRLRPPERGPWRPPQVRPGDDTCALDRAARGAWSDAEISAWLGNTRQAVEKVARGALRKVAAGLGISPAALTTLLGDG